MAFDRHTVFGAILVAIVVAAVIAGIAITGGPGEARKQKEDRARLEALTETARALACYHQSIGAIPEDLSLVEEEFAHAASGVRGLRLCHTAAMRPDPITHEAFRLKRSDGKVTHICADFATSSPETPYYLYNEVIVVAPGLGEARKAPGEQCYELNLDAELK
ncbi:MAG: hypothetical protein KDA53_01670 [Hyphomonas sp.]|nr:hypothetical protein [Hyphomonas sp.]